MTKFINFGNKTIGLRFSAGAFIKYKEEFGTEYPAENEKIQEMLKGNHPTIETIQKVLDNIKKITWCMADLYSPCSQAEIFGLCFDNRAVQEINYWLHESVSCGEDAESTGEKENFNSENFVAICLECGLTMRDIEKYSVRFLVNIVNRYIDLHKPEEAKKATQEDINMIFGR